MKEKGMTRNPNRARRMRKAGATVVAVHLTDPANRADRKPIPGVQRLWYWG